MTGDKEDIHTITNLSNDEFLAAWDNSLTQLKGTSSLISSRHTHTKPTLIHTPQHDVKVAGVDAMVRVVSAVGRWTAGSDLTAHLTSAGLQPERANLLSSQMERVKQLTSPNLNLRPREQLVDLQWKFGVVAGSSVDGETGKTFVQVQFRSSLPNDQTHQPRTRVVEMSLQDFYNFLHQLEKCQASLQLMNCL
ncbi:hypothetical protein Pmani_035891 [Petrolisthes manimaculis]|uniref:COMM domain-containing protein n=1 Tax=Petrolisthes manimaculis TaxID=1843537 RepID=A0AAE1NLE7_9EUCA|nr:hypothetical protein Pmani_035891 [Petrolisthes manimaculis]